MDKIERQIIKDALINLSFELNRLPLSTADSISTAKQLLNSLKYKFKSKYSYYFYCLASNLPLVYGVDLKEFCETMKIDSYDPNSDQFQNFIKDLEKGFDLKYEILNPSYIKFTINEIINVDHSYNTANFSITAKTPRLYSIKLDQEFILEVDTICWEFKCKKYENFAHLRQNVLLPLLRDYDMTIDVAEKKQRKVTKLKFKIHKILAKVDV